MFAFKSPTLIRLGQWAGSLAAMPRPLAISPCLRECRWSGTEETLGGERLYACASCGSEWVRSEAWTPADWTGTVPDAVQRERERDRGRG